MFDVNDVALNDIPTYSGAGPFYICLSQASYRYSSSTGAIFVTKV